MADRPAVTVIGAGVVGTCCALHLQNEGFAVTPMRDGIRAGGIAEFAAPPPPGCRRSKAGSRPFPPSFLGCRQASLPIAAGRGNSPDGPWSGRAADDPPPNR